MPLDLHRKCLQNVSIEFSGIFANPQQKLQTVQHQTLHPGFRGKRPRKHAAKMRGSMKGGEHWDKTRRLSTHVRLRTHKASSRIPSPPSPKPPRGKPSSGAKGLPACRASTWEPKRTFQEIQAKIPHNGPHFKQPQKDQTSQRHRRAFLLPSLNTPKWNSLQMATEVSASLALGLCSPSK